MKPVKTTRPDSARSIPPRSPHRFGAHLSIAGGMHNALLAAHRLKFATVQVFVKNQRQWRAPPLDPAVVDHWRELLDRPGFGPAVAHATYLINLASADKQLSAKSRDAFTIELQRCQTLGIAYLVVHPGAAGEQRPALALRRVAEALNRIFDKHPDLTVMPLLETTAGQGTALGRSFEELGAIIDSVAEPQRVGVCIDTCHVFAAGFDIRDPQAYAAMIATVADTVGVERIRCFHLNDSKHGLGSHRDRHEHIGKGAIGSAGFVNVLLDKRFRDVPMILETPKGDDPNEGKLDKLNIRRLRSLYARALKRQRG